MPCRMIQGTGGPCLPTAGGRSGARRPHAWTPLWTLDLQPARDGIPETLRGRVRNLVSAWRPAAGRDSLSVTLGGTTRGRTPWGAVPVGLTVP